MADSDFDAVIVAAGRAERFGGAIPKQFLDLGGKTILERSVAALTDRPAVRGVVVVLAGDELAGGRGEKVRRWPGVVEVVAGGPTRAESVARGVAATAAPYLLVHDAARPLVPAHVVDAVVAATREHGAAVPGLAVVDTVKRVDATGRVRETVDRDDLRLAQTPQGARREWLVEALDRVQRAAAPPTDEAAALEAAGRRVVVVAGDADNVKITSPRDLDTARLRFAPSVDDLRVGTGFDIHRRGGDGALVLGGVPFPGETGLVGHSDADVVLHAAMDAVLGAAGLGDIGVHFPPDDPSFAGADSAALAARVARMLDDAGYALINLDVMLLAERPKIGDRREAMRAAIAACFNVTIDRVGLKATTLERLGALGRGEGIACEATCLIARQRAPGRGR